MYDLSLKNYKFDQYKNSVRTYTVTETKQRLLTRQIHRTYFYAQKHQGAEKLNSCIKRQTLTSSN